MPPPVSVLAEAVVHDLEVREIIYRDSLIPRHAHVNAGFCLVLEGTYEERYAGRTLACRPRTVTFSPAGEEHSNVFSARRSHCLTVDLPALWIKRLDIDAARMREPFETQGGTLAWVAERLLHEVRGGNDGGSPLIIEGMILEMMGIATRTAARKETQASPAIRRTRELLAAHFREPLALSDLAAASGRHPVYLATAFRQAYGETIGECIRRLRVEYAAHVLAQSDMPIVDIALSSGFGNQSHLTRTFKRATGLTPGQYRERHRA